MATSRNKIAMAALVASAGCFVASSQPQRAFAEAAGSSDPASPDFVPPLPPTYKAGGVTVEEKLGATLPTSARFIDHTGKRVTLGEVLSGELPTILTFNYNDCPNLCSTQLNGLTAVMPALAKPHKLTQAEAAIVGASDPEQEVSLVLGQHYRIVTLVLEPKQPLTKTNSFRDKYLERIGSKAGEPGWTYLQSAEPDAAPMTDQGQGDPAIASVADAVGFRYVYLADSAQWAHPAALIFISSKGRVTRYVHGAVFEESALRESILRAGVDNPATAVGFLNRCYHFDPDANNYSRAGVLALRLGAVGFIVVFLSGLGIWLLIRRQRQTRTAHALGELRS